MSDKNDKKFTFDPETEGAEVPTLTSLLYKKSLSKSKGSKGPPAMPVTLEPTQTFTVENHAQPPVPTMPGEAAMPVALEIAPAHGDGLALPIEPATVLAIDGAQQNRSEATPLGLAPLTDFSPVSLTAGSKEAPSISSLPSVPSLSVSTDTSPAAPFAPSFGGPEGRGLAHLQQKGLLLRAAILASESGSGRYLFQRSAGSEESASLWRGMGIDPREFSDLMSRLGRLGFIEFSPLGAADPQGERKGFRTAFGVESKEWLTLVRIGTSATPQSLVAVISPSSIQSQLPFFHSAVAKAA